MKGLTNNIKQLWVLCSLSLTETLITKFSNSLVCCDIKYFNFFASVKIDVNSLWQMYLYILYIINCTLTDSLT